MAKQLRELKGVGEKTEKLFQKIGITTTDDLLHYYPRNYDAYEEPEEIGSLKENTVAAIRATITTGVYVNKIRNLQVISITVADTTGRLAVACKIILSSEARHWRDILLRHGKEVGVCGRQNKNIDCRPSGGCPLAIARNFIG